MGNSFFFRNCFITWLTQDSTSGLEENSIGFSLNCSLLYIQVYYLFLFKLQAIHQLLVQLQSISNLFIVLCHSWGNSWQYPPLKGPYSKDFIVYHIGPVNYPFCFLYPIFLFYLLQILTHFLLSLLYPFLGLFLMFSFLLLFLISIVFNSFPIFPNILYQIFCYPIYTVVLLYIFLVILLCDFLSSSFSLFFWSLLCILFQTYLLILVHSPDFSLVPKCLLLLYNLSIVPGIYLFL